MEIDITILDQINIEKIVHVNYEETILQKNFQILIGFLRNLQKGYLQVKEVNQNNSDEIQKLKENDAKQQNQISSVDTINKQLEKEIQQLKIKSDKHESDISDLKQELNDKEKRLINNEREIELLKEILNKLTKNNDNKDLLDQLQALQNLYNNLKSELEKLKLQFNLLGGNVGPQESLDSSTLDRILQEFDRIKQNFKDDDLQEQINRLKQNIQEGLNSLEEKNKQKVDNQVYQSEINRMWQFLQGLNNKDGPPIQITQGLGANELALLNDLQRSVRDLEEMLKKLRGDLDYHIGDYNKFAKVTNKRLEDLENQMKFTAKRDQLEKLDKEMQNQIELSEQLNTQMKDNAKRLKEHKRIIDDILSRLGNGNGGGNQGISGISEEALDEKLRQLKEEILNILNQFKIQLEKKPSHDDLQKSYMFVLQKLDEVAEAIQKKFADKGDTKKALSYIENKINQLYLMITKDQTGQGRPGAEDGLLVKKPLFWSCASCDKGLDQFQGRLGDYKNWAIFPPKETTPERMGRYGKGYKNMLENQRKKQEKILLEINQYNDHLPNIVKDQKGQFDTH